MNIKVNNLTISVKTFTSKTTGVTTQFISQADAFRIQQSFKRGKLKEMEKICRMEEALKMGNSVMVPLVIGADKRLNLIACETTKSNLRGESK